MTVSVVPADEIISKLDNKLKILHRLILAAYLKTAAKSGPAHWWDPGLRQQLINQENCEQQAVFKVTNAHKTVIKHYDATCSYKHLIGTLPQDLS